MGGLEIRDRTTKLASGVVVMKGAQEPVWVTTPGEVFRLLEQYQEICKQGAVEWKFKDALLALQIDPSWLADEFTLQVIRVYRFYSKAPHEVFPGPYGAQPFFWADIQPSLNDIFTAGLF